MRRRTVMRIVCAFAAGMVAVCAVGCQSDKGKMTDAQYKASFGHEGDAPPPGYAAYVSSHQSSAPGNRTQSTQ